MHVCELSLDFILIDMQFQQFIILKNICGKKQMCMGSFQEKKQKKIYLYTCAYNSLSKNTLIYSGIYFHKPILNFG